MLELVTATYLSCYLVKNIIHDDTRMCFYQCRDTTRDFASTEVYYDCPSVMKVDRKPLKFKDQDREGNRWTIEEIEKMTK